MARSGAPSVRRSFDVSCVTESSRLCFSFRRAARCSVEPVSPNIRSKVTRGLMPTGSGLVSSRQESALKKVQGNPSQAPTAVPMSSVPTSIERSGVSPRHLVGDVLIDRLLRLDLAEGVAGSLSGRRPGRRR